MWITIPTLTVMALTGSPLNCDQFPVFEVEISLIWINPLFADTGARFCRIYVIRNAPSAGGLYLIHADKKRAACAIFFLVFREFGAPGFKLAQSGLQGSIRIRRGPFMTWVI